MLLDLLPIEIVFFNAIPQGEGIELQWQTASEINNSTFTIEKSRDSRTFVSLVEIPAKGELNNITGYEYLDRYPFYGLNYYRLKQIDLGGKVSYSEVIAINNPHTPKKISIFPNPSSDHLIINLNNESPPNQVDLDVYCFDGTQYAKYSFNGNEQVKVDTRQWPSGIYIIRIQLDEEVSTIKKIVVER